MKKRLKQVMLVDDDQVTNYLNEVLIKDMDFAEQICLAHDGQQALEAIKLSCEGPECQGACPELILLDINMPIMDGFEFLQEFEKLRQQHNISVILLTTSANQRDISKAGSFEVSGYINKPLSKEKIAPIILEKFGLVL